MHLIWILVAAALNVWLAASTTLPSSYDVVWTSPSQTNGSASSMPLGGGDVGLNVWVENGRSFLMYA